MLPTDGENQDLDQRIGDMQKSIDDLRGRCFSNSAFRLAEDLIRLARREQRLIPTARNVPVRGQSGPGSLSASTRLRGRRRDDSPSPKVPIVHVTYSPTFQKTNIPELAPG